MFDETPFLQQELNTLWTTRSKMAARDPADYPDLYEYVVLKALLDNRIRAIQDELASRVGWEESDSTVESLDLPIRARDLLGLVEAESSPEHSLIADFLRALLAAQSAPQWIGGAWSGEDEPVENFAPWEFAASRAAALQSSPEAYSLAISLGLRTVLSRYLPA